jgi:hypothetical protein
MITQVGEPAPNTPEVCSPVPAPRPDLGQQAAHVRLAEERGDAEGRRRLPQPPQVVGERMRMAAVGAQGLERADAAQESQVEDADGGLGRGYDAAVHGEVVGAHGRPAG